MKLLVLPSEHFTCSACSKCCFHWHVELTPPEIQALPKLSWPAGDPLASVTPFFKHSNKTFLAKAPDAGCVFLNRANGLCRIHEQFGESAKPLGCRLYPFQITPTFPGQASVSARFDCPTVRQNSGAPHSSELPALRRLAPNLHLPAPFDDDTTNHLTADQIQSVAEFAATLLPGLPSDPARALFLYILCDFLAPLPPDELDRAALASAFPEIKHHIDQILSSPTPPRPGVMVRLAFRSLLVQYLRRDEDILNHRASRAGRALAMLATLANRGSLSSLGVAHPPGSLAKARLFKSSPAEIAEGAFAVFWRYIRVQLESLQFMAPTVGRRDFLSGLRALSLLYPLALALAKYRAANRNSPRIDPEDADYATSALAHAHNRSPVLSQPHARSQESLLLTPDIYPSLLRTL